MGFRWLCAYLWPSTNGRVIVKRLQEELWMRPHWCAAMTYTVAHHAMCDPRTPFGSPLVVSPEHEVTMREVLKLLRELQLDHPGTSLPDLWAAAASYAVAHLGGPLMTMSWGRLEEEFPPDPIVVMAPKVSSLTDDVRTIKRTLGGRCELAADEMVALLGHRTIGVHGGAHGARQVALMREASAEMIETNKFVVKEATPSDDEPGMGSSTPGVFDNDYFVSLEKDGWQPVVKTGGFFGLGGSGKRKAGNAGDALPEPPIDCDSPEDLRLHLSENAPCVGMQPLDVTMRKDLMLLPWIQKFAENEVRFFNAYGRAAGKVLRCGWEGWNLRDG
uniref:Plant heme peroxidase family profile domain-containing protein n=1 Tax=Neobodo designis TaxID=312471 RepID=A0A7S1KY02_NEODS|mmetsp:Transcript_1104/g.3622  ORF Transcript_1104/g.3622 Transcript_1104/m.3622 type:complete len:331 (+) Transcript_1104:2-994(+)